MKKPELLAPAGSMEALKAAVNNGADAVYLGGSRFGARAYAQNFDERAMVEAVRFCHIRGVRVYVTFNTLVYEDELAEAMKMVDFYYHAQVDALIIQDLGLFEMVRQTYPDFELHCSTQMHIHNLEGIRLMKKWGASRVVVARETPLELIRDWTKEEIEIEVFVYGALCISYSGQCLLSSLNGGRSGNRGECAQPCRMKYQLQKGNSYEPIQATGEYWLSPRDLYTLDHLEALLEAGISSFKIEGRMKRPEYVGEVVHLYRKAIDAWFEKRSWKLGSEEKESLMKLFHRGFTSGHLFHAVGSSLMNSSRPNHQGILLGEVMGRNQQRLVLKLSHDLHQGDGIRILSKNQDSGLTVHRILKDGKLVNQAKASETVELETSKSLVYRPHDLVVLTTDRNQCESILKRSEKIFRPILLQGRFEARIGQPAVFFLSDEMHEIEVSSVEIVSLAKKAPLQQDQIRKQLNKLGDTPYQYQSLELNCDSSIFLSLRSLNELRRQAVEKINEARIAVNRKIIPLFEWPKSIKQDIQGDWFDADRIEQAEAVIHSKQPLFSCFPDVLNRFSEAGQKGLRAEEKTSSFQSRFILHSQLGSLLQPKEKGQIWLADTGFNVTNSYALHFLAALQVDGVVASLEASDSQIEAMIQGYQKRYGAMPCVGKRVYGRRELMIMKHCVVNTALSDGNRVQCRLCQNERYALKNEKGDRFLLGRDPQCHSILFEEKPFISMACPKGISFRMFRFTLEDRQETEKVLQMALEIPFSNA